MMLIIRRPGRDPFFNIAAEEYLVKTLESDCFMVWLNNPSVVTGKHQNALAEVNVPFIHQHEIPVIRRISGGGTVYHDPGNINFTFISAGQKEKLVDYEKFLTPILEVLNNMGIPAKTGGKNAILVNDLKISGNSEHVFQNKVLHHGTLLFSSDLNRMDLVINPHREKYSDKAIQSVKSKVGNVRDYLKRTITIDDFMEKITQYIREKSAVVETRDLTATEVFDISTLVKEKYNTWQWNYGYSPAYNFRNRIHENGMAYEAELLVNNGIIQKTVIRIDKKLAPIDNFFENLLTGKRHDYQTIDNILRSENLLSGSNKFNLNLLLRLLF